ncbi:MAG: hypothetical protein EXR62_06530 [Chloroflexi bacterium]|nr:hypothetical protein [Chloroflexota bacterium]
MIQRSQPNPTKHLLLWWQTRYQDLLALAAYAGLAALFYAPLLLRQRFLPPGDFTYHFLPFSVFQQHELAAGRLPLWNPYTYAGHPFLADVQAAVFYPLSNLLLLLTLPWSSAAGRLYFLQAEAALHLALAGFFTYLLVRTLTGERWAAFLAGTIFAFSGYLTGYPPLQLAILRTAIWLPLILWILYLAAARNSESDRNRWILWIAAAIAYACAFLAGHSQTFLHLSYVVAAWLAILCCAGWQRVKGDRAAQFRLWLGILLFYALFLLLVAAQLLPSLEFSRLTIRANLDYTAASGGFPLQDTWQLLFPNLLSFFSPLYIGIVGFGLALFALAGVGLGRFLQPGNEFLPARSEGLLISYRTGVTFFGVLALLSLLVSYGGNSFLYPVLYRWAPGWNLFRGQERAAFVVALAGSILAGYGAALLRYAPIIWRKWFTIGWAVSLIGATIVFTLIWQSSGKSGAAQAPFVIVAAKTGGIALLFGVLFWQRRLDRWLMPLLLTCAILDLFSVNYGTNLNTTNTVRDSVGLPEIGALQAQIRQEAQDAPNLPGRVANEYRVYEDYGMLASLEGHTDIEDTGGSSPLLLARYAALFKDFPRDRAWRLAGVGYFLTWARDIAEPHTLIGEFPQAQDTTYLHQLISSHPRAWVVDQVQLEPETGAVDLLADKTFDLNRMALVSPDSCCPGMSPNTSPAALQQMHILAAPGHNNINLQRLTPNRIRAEVESEQGGMLVISENWMPGWSATINSIQPATQQPQTNTFPVMRTDYTFIGIPLAAGKSTIDLVYWPDSIRIGVVISGATLALLILYALWQYFTAKRGGRHHVR